MINDKIFFDEKDPTGINYDTPFVVFGSFNGRLWSKTPEGTVKFYVQGEDIINDLTTGGVDKVLSAEQGVEAKTLIDGKVAKAGDTMTGLLRATAGINFEASGGDTLSDYEVGTWTPVVTGTSGSAGTFAASVTGRFTVIGRMCYPAMRITVSDIGSWEGIVRISLPFTVVGGAVNERGSVGIATTTFTGSPTFRSLVGSNQGDIILSTSGGALSALNHPLSVNSQFEISTKFEI